MFSVTKIRGKENAVDQKEFLCDLESDIAKFPTNIVEGTQNSGVGKSNDLCSVGSTAFVIETSSVYMLGNDSVWHKL